MLPALSLAQLALQRHLVASLPSSTPSPWWPRGCMAPGWDNPGLLASCLYLLAICKAGLQGTPSSHWTVREPEAKEEEPPGRDPRGPRPGGEPRGSSQCQPPGPKQSESPSVVCRPAAAAAAPTAAAGACRKRRFSAPLQSLGRRSRWGPVRRVNKPRMLPTSIPA